MKLKFSSVVIDTNASREEHKKAIESNNHLHCSKDEPYYFFTYKLQNGNERFVHVRYNNEGTKLVKINSWDHVHKELVEKRIQSEQCYFNKNDETKWETIMVLEDKPYSENNYTWWENGKFIMNEYEPPKIISDVADGLLPKDVPNDIIQKKKRWGLF